MSRKHDKETQTGQGNRWNNEEDDERAAHTEKRKRERRKREGERERACTGRVDSRTARFVGPPAAQKRQVGKKQD
jgi:hypothetical protein